ncbi:MAG TPA: DUF1778 domain-containing protein [Stellaceae bacterium]|nr:DUF1778 domain-containing protein [Stellaceae bacterium]
MPRPQAAKRDRMHLRLDLRTKRTLERAAAYEGKSVTDFVLATATAAAERVVERREKVVLPQADWDLFFRALVKPPPPNKILKAAVRRFRDRRGD